MFLYRIQLNHPYTHKRHRFLPAQAFRRKSAPLVTSSKTCRPTGFGETIAKILVNIDRRSCLGVKGPSRRRTRSKRRAAALLVDLLRGRANASVVKKQTRRIARMLKYVPGALEA